MKEIKEKMLNSLAFLFCYIGLAMLGKNQNVVDIDEFLPEKFSDIAVPDKFVDCIHIHFSSKNGNGYTAIIVFHHPDGPYIHLLNKNKDKDYSDFKEVSRIVELTHNGKAEPAAADNDGDIRQIINLYRRPTQKEITAAIKNSYSSQLNNVRLTHIYYNGLPSRILARMALSEKRSLS